MSQFNYNDYQKVIEKAQNGGSNAVKVGFFKLKNDGDEALVRIDCGSLDSLSFASVHQLTVTRNGKRSWPKVSCLNPLGSFGNQCPLCEANAAGNASVGKASKKVYIKMLVSYKDSVTGQFTAPEPVVWERPAGFSREIANKLRDYGDLRKVLLKITRNGVAGDMKTTYSLDYAVPTVFKPELIPEDFSAFNNFNIAKHSYWEKTPDEINEFLMTGEFPERETAATQATAPQATPVYSTPVYAAPTAPQQAVINPQAVPVAGTPVMPQPAPVAPQPIPTVQPVMTQPMAQTESAERPVRNFNGFSF